LWRIFTLTSNNFNVHEIFVGNVLRKLRCGKNWVLPADRENSFRKVCFFLARPSVKGVGSNPTAVTLLDVGRLPLSGIQNTWQRVPFAFTNKTWLVLSHQSS